MMSLGGIYKLLDYVDVLGLIEMDLCYLQFDFLCVNVGWYMFGHVCYHCYVVCYKCDELLLLCGFYLVYKRCVVVELWCFVRFLKFCFLYGGYIYFVLV